MRERCNSMGIIEFLEPEFDLNNVVNGLCVNFDGSRRVMRYAIAHEMIKMALPPIVTSRFLYIPNSSDYRTVPIAEHKIQLPSEVALKIASFLVGSARDLDALAATSVAFRAVARSPEVLEALTQAWLPSHNARLQLRSFCPRSLSMTFSKIQLTAEIFGWDAVLWQSAALGCIHGIWLALGQGANVDTYSGGRENAEGPALWCAAKFNHLNAVRLLVEEGGANVEGIGGIITRSTPLWVAAREGNTSVVQYLLSMGADPTSRNDNGRGYSVQQMAQNAYGRQHGTSHDEMLLTIQLIADREHTW